jgi:hypothetical protein
MRGVYPVTDSLWHADQSMYTDDMMLGLCVALGIFLLIAARNPSANRSLIPFTAWSSFAHGAVVAVMAFQKANERRELLGGTAALVVIVAALIALAPAKQAGETASAAAGDARTPETPPPRHLVLQLRTETSYRYGVYHGLFALLDDRLARRR